MAEIDIDELREELLQCRRCGLCREAVYEAAGFDGICPVWRNTSGFETAFMRGKIMVALALLEGRLDKTAENGESLFQCTLCGNCTQICPAEFEPARTLEQVRTVLGDIPNPVRDRLADGILKKDNPYDEEPSAKRRWVEKLDFEVPKTGEVLYYAGCTSALRLPQVAIDAARILKEAGVNFAVMENEPCCGSVMLRTGRYEDAVENAREVAKRIASTGAKRVVVTCAGCYKTLKQDYAKMGIDMPEIVPMAEFAKELIAQGKINLSGNTEQLVVTYHDPCHLGREIGVFDSPREVVGSVPGVTLVEMETNREKAMCCGAGGGLRSFDGDLAKKIAADRVRDALAVGAKTIVTACPFCEHNLAAGAEIADEDVEVVDIVNLLARSMKE
ncbi:MAG: (Fe-S)-binding protein [Candidatus Thorarchaeota archaeon]